jgi:hypothetical protein
VHGTIDPATATADVRARFTNVDVSPAAAYLPPPAPLIIDGGRADATLRVRYGRGDGVRVDGDGALENLALTLRLGPPVEIRDERMAFTVADLRLQGERVTLEAATTEGTPALGRPGQADRPLSRLHLELRGLRWPGRAEASWRAVAEPSEGGRVELHGGFVPATRSVTVTLTAADAAIAPFAPLLPVEAAVAGRLDASMRATVSADAPLSAAGQATVRDVTLGPPGAPPIRLGRVTARDVDLRDGTLTIGHLAVEQPVIVVEREKDGSFPLRAMLTPARSPAGPGDAGASTPDVEEEGSKRAMTFGVERLDIRDGDLRFIDRTTTPFYSEELRRLAITVDDLGNSRDGRATVAIQGIVGVDAALDLKGETAPFATPFFLDVAGELHDFSVPRTNPYLEHFLDWIARRGKLATRVHYRIEGDQLTATNELTVRRLDVERARDADRSERLVGLPLGLAVALLKDARGEIHVTVPVSGSFSSPKFSFGNAIRTALKHVLSRMITAPLRAIGSVFRRDDAVTDVAIEPATFAPGSAVLTPDVQRHLERVADFLRARPYVRLTLRPVVSEEDIEALRVEEVTARIQRVERDEGLGNFAAAARRVWRAARGDTPAPDAETIVHELARTEAVPSAAERVLAERRLGVSRTYLVETAGIQGYRLVAESGAPPAGVAGEGRVEFSLGTAPS